MVSVGDFSKELCGGTHIKNTSEIGLFKIVKEMSVSSGVRRIEAVTSRQALNFISKKEHLLTQLCELIEAPEPKALDALVKLKEEYKETKSSYKKLQRDHIENLVNHILSEKQPIKEHFYISKEVSMDSSEFTIFATELLSKLKDGLIILANNYNGNYQLLVQKTKSATSLPSSKVLLDAMLSHLDGKGGGSEIVARGSFNQPTNISKAFAHVYSLLSFS